MQRVIRLVDLRSVPMERHPDYTVAEQNEARRVHMSRGLKFDNLTGVLSNKQGWLSRPSGYVHEPYQTVEDVLNWAFKGTIHNSISRVRRGHNP